MKDWWIAAIITIAVIYVSAAISSSENAIAVALSKLAKQVEEMNDKIDVLTEKVDDVEYEVSGKGQKWRDRIDRHFGH